jgi:hypothetical protein
MWSFGAAFGGLSRKLYYVVVVHVLLINSDFIVCAGSEKKKLYFEKFAGRLQYDEFKL